MGSGLEYICVVWRYVLEISPYLKVDKDIFVFVLPNLFISLTTNFPKSDNPLLSAGISPLSLGEESALNS
jgi:hypothetical protein